jgi:hypothetical protein
MLVRTMRARFVRLVALTLLASVVLGAVATPAMAAEKHNIKVIRKIAAKKKLPAADVKALITLCKRESGYNARCITGSYKGLFQLRTRDKRWSDPEWNTAVAIKEIQHRYHTPRAALAHSYRHGWY